jgi:hypothetical protein
MDHLCFRSFLPRNQQIRVPDSSRKRRSRYELMALELASHLALTSLLFLVFVAGVWVATWALHSLHSVCPFPDVILQFLDKLEIGLVYADGALICITLLSGMWLYVLYIFRGHS